MRVRVCVCDCIIRIPVFTLNRTEIIKEAVEAECIMGGVERDMRTERVAVTQGGGRDDTKGDR